MAIPYAVVKVFKERLTVLVESEGKEHKEIAKKIGISEQNMSNYLKKDDNRFPRADMLLRMSAYFNVSVDYLLGRQEGKTPSREAIQRRLGLSDKAIDSLRKLQIRHPEERDSVIVGINTLLESSEGRNVAQLIASYVNADFDQAYSFLPPTHPHEPIKTLDFLLKTSPDGSKKTYVPLHVSSFKEALIFQIGEYLRAIREKTVGIERTPGQAFYKELFSMVNDSLKGEKHVNQEDSE